MLIGRPKLWWNANFLDRGLNPLVTSCSSDVQNVVKCEVCTSAKQPSRHFVVVGRPKLWWNASFEVVRATLSSFRAHRTSKTVVKRKFWSGPRNPFVVSCSSDVQNCGETQIWLRPRNPLVTSCWSDVRNCGKMVIFVWRGLPRTSCARFIHFCARRCSETHILKFWMARRCSETHILILQDEPSRRIRWVDCTKLWRNANFEL